MDRDLKQMKRTRQLNFFSAMIDNAPLNPPQNMLPCWETCASSQLTPFKVKKKEHIIHLYIFFSGFGGLCPTYSCPPLPARRARL